MSPSLVYEELKNVSINTCRVFSLMYCWERDEARHLMPLSSWSLCCLWHHRLQHLNHSPLSNFDSRLR